MKYFNKSRINRIKVNLIVTTALFIMFIVFLATFCFDSCPDITIELFTGLLKEKDLLLMYPLTYLVIFLAIYLIQEIYVLLSSLASRKEKK